MFAHVIQKLITKYASNADYNFVNISIFQSIKLKKCKVNYFMIMLSPEFRM